MLDWQAELELLLSQLQVSMEQVPSRVRQESEAESVTLIQQPEPGEPDISGSWEMGSSTDEISLDGIEVSAVRSEIEATIERVVSLAQASRIENALRDDVVFVLQALIRPHPQLPSARSRRNSQRDLHREWHLVSAAAVLRFCRIVLRLTNALTSDLDE